MYQLSLGHALAIPPPSHPDDHSTGHHARAVHLHGPDDAATDVHTHSVVLRDAVPSSATGLHQASTNAVVIGSDRVSDVMPGSGAVVTVASPIGDPGDVPGDDGCPDCDEHSMALGACLLALTLLVLSWPLLLPRARPLPPMLRLRLAPAVVLVARRIPALSLAELSILRT
jgi:hypothetical protein